VNAYRRRPLTWIVAAVVAVNDAACAVDDVVISHLSPDADEAGGRASTGGTGGAGGLGRPNAGAGGVAGHGSGGSPEGNGGATAPLGAGGIASGGATQAGGKPFGGAGAATMDAGIPAACFDTNACPPGWTCSKGLGCAVPSGVCEPRPVICDPNPLPVCGCDQITYWNDCVRKQNGITGSTPGQCGVGARVCTSASDCNVPGAVCSHVNPAALACSSLGPGTCWVTPLDCSGTPPAPKWALCQSPPLPPLTPVPCVNTCEAIRSGQQYATAPAGGICQ
jgi:hypothetical protein